MNTKHQVHNLIILDESGSMHSIKSTIIQGFNEVVQTVKGMAIQFPEQEHSISFLTFNTFGNKLIHFVDPASSINELNAESFNPNGGTPLLDAMGFSINKLKAYLQGKTDYNVLVTILTDGEENASVEYSGNAIKMLVEELKQNNWTFTYMGTDHDVDQIALSLSINNTLKFQKSEAGIKSMFAHERRSREVYFQKIRSNEDTQSDYFKDNEAK